MRRRNRERGTTQLDSGCSQQPNGSEEHVSFGRRVSTAANHRAMLYALVDLWWPDPVN